MADLVIRDLHVSVAGKEVIKGLSLTVKGGEVHAIMGPNGTGKTTLSMAVAGHPRYEITSGEVWLGDQNLLEMSVDERARAGLFLAFQYPAEIPGVPVKNYLRQIYNAVKGTDLEVFEFYNIMMEKMQMMKMDPSFANRHLNEGFSGGEKKRHEILQMALLEPKIAILDETDSGLDIDALKIVSEGVNSLRGPELGVLVITHYHRLLEYIKPDIVHVMMDGRIVRSGGPELALELEAKGYDWIRSEVSAGKEV
ncbi:ABC transporter ATP-binding protein [Collibacillus ludicampi]|uniref:ABC transporter ATP-binding protein n=1 Tax=Collibacillus ludicampi TaxID=2771369 RepID=A0AAV4LB67_9BACL|nr:Fe-S cluster assembly ATPase SufC [Collibacillus ludicampi]GIM45032.1 ABC transporter ATP-binding protein [Collibacillus ludicampi]